MKYLKRFESNKDNIINQYDIDSCCVELYDKGFNIRGIRYDVGETIGYGDIDCLFYLDRGREFAVKFKTGLIFIDIAKHVLIDDDSYIVKQNWPNHLIELDINIDGNINGNISMTISPTSRLTAAGKELVEMVEDSAIKLLNMNSYKSVKIDIRPSYSRWDDPMTFQRLGYYQNDVIRYRFYK